MLIPYWVSVPLKNAKCYPTMTKLQQLWVILGIANEDAAHQLLAVLAETQPAVGAIHGAAALHVQDFGVLAIELALEPEALVRA